MTIDNDTGRAIATVTLREAMERYSCDKNIGLEHLAVLADACKEAQAAFVKALKKNDRDAMLGAATRLDQYTSKLQSFTQKIATNS